MKSSGDNKARTILIADDHAIVRQSVAQILLLLPDVEIVAEAENGLEAIASARAHLPALMVLDAAMPMARGIEVYSEVRRWSPATRIILFTAFNSRSFLCDWLDAGVDGLLLKNCPIDEMKECFETVLAGGRYVAAEVSTLVADAPESAALTNREREVLALIAAGLGNDAIGDRLCISPKTVEKHRGTLMSKLGVHSISGLMAYALREGLLDELKQL